MVSVWSYGYRHEGVGMTSPETSWIEQEAIEKWWNKHRFELKQAVTVERVRLQGENDDLREQCAEYQKFVFETGKGVGENALEAEKLKLQVENLRSVADNAQEELVIATTEIVRLKHEVGQLEKWINKHLESDRGR